MGVAGPRPVGAGQVAARRPPVVAAALVEPGQRLELLLAAPGQPGLEPLRRRQVVAGPPPRLGRLDHQLALEVVLEHDLDVAGQGRVGRVERQEVVALGQREHQVGDPAPGPLAVAPLVVERIGGRRRQVDLEPGQRDHRRQPEHVAEHRRLLEQVALVALERRDPGLDRLLDADRQLGRGRPVGVELPRRARRVDRAVGQEQPDQLLEEVRVAAGHLDRGVGDVVGDRAAPREEVAEHRLGVVGLEVAQVDALVIDVALAPARRPDQHLGPGRRQDHDRRSAQPGRQLRHQAQRRVVGPLQVVEDQDQRALVGVDLEEPAQDGPRDLVLLPGALGEDPEERRRWEVEADEPAQEVQGLDLALAHHILDLGGEPLPGQRVVLAGRELEAVAEQRRDRGVALRARLGPGRGRRGSAT